MEFKNNEQKHLSLFLRGSMPKLAKGSGGLEVPQAMRDLADQAKPPLRFLSGKNAQKLRDLYDLHTASFDPTLLSPFGFAVFIGDLEEVKKLGVPADVSSDTPFEWGWASLAVLGAQRIRGGPTPLRHRAVLAFLLTQQVRRVDPDLPDIAGYTALHHASMNAPITGLIEELLEHGANANARDKFGCTPLLCALCQGGQDACVVLLAGGADPAIADGDGTRFDKFPQVLIANVLRKAKLLREQKKSKAKGKVSAAVPLAAMGAGRPSEDNSSSSDSSERLAAKPEGESIVITEVPECPRECIVKIQVPLGGTGGDLLIYDEHRSFRVIYSKSREPDAYSRIVQAINERCHGYKGYFKAERVGKDGMRVYLDPAEEQPW